MSDGAAQATALLTHLQALEQDLEKTAATLVVAGARLDMEEATLTSVAGGAAAPATALALTEAAGVRPFLDSTTTVFAKKAAHPAAAATIKKIASQAHPTAPAASVVQPAWASESHRRMVALASPGLRLGVCVTNTAQQWAADASIPVCPICSTSFSLLQRRHHCRQCGVLVCAKCSSHKFALLGGAASASAGGGSAGASGSTSPVPSSGTATPRVYKLPISEERVCGGCFNRLNTAVQRAAKDRLSARSDDWQASPSVMQAIAELAAASAPAAGTASDTDTVVVLSNELILQKARAIEEAAVMRLD